MSNEERDQLLYRYPNSEVLRNKLDIRDAERLAQAEKMLVQERIEQGCPSGSFDLKHLQDIHRHLFQDVYEWAGEIRQVDFHKGTWFHPANRIGMGMQDVHRRLEQQNRLRNLDWREFAKQAAVIIGDVNHCHPFREGNGRTQMQYLKQLGDQAGHSVDLTRFTRQSWIEASIQSRDAANYEPMEKCIRAAMIKRDRSRDRGMDD